MSGLMANPKWIQIVNAEAVRKAKQNLQVSSALHRSISRSIKSMDEISQQIRETFSSSSVMDSFYSNLEASDKETKELSDILGLTYGEEAEEAAPSLADYDIGGIGNERIYMDQDGSLGVYGTDDELPVAEIDGEGTSSTKKVGK